MQCWKFHGKMPSHKKQEKMRKKEIEEKKLHQMDSTKDSKFKKALEKEQSTKHLPFLAISMRGLPK